MLRPRLLALLGLLALLACVPSSVAGAERTRTFVAAGTPKRVATFALKGLSAERVRRAELRTGSHRRSLAAGTVRAGIRSGRLRLRLTPAMQRSRRSAATRRRSPVRLVVWITAPGSGSAASAGDAPSTETGGPAAAAPGAGETAAPAAIATRTPITAWRAGSAPLTDAEAAARVTPRAEIRPENSAANHYVPSAGELAAFHASRYTSGPASGLLGDENIPERRHVTGGFAGTTDEILQWAAHKWGIPEDLLRAVAHTESTWRQSQQGDLRAGVYESLGLMQVKWRSDGSLHPGTEPLRWKSTAFNVDYWAANIRFFYNGTAIRWFRSNAAYAAAQEWLSIGGWFQPSPWNNPDQLAYIERVKVRAAGRAWERPGF